MNAYVHTSPVKIRNMIRMGRVNSNAKDLSYHLLHGISISFLITWSSGCHNLPCVSETPNFLVRRGLCRSGLTMFMVSEAFVCCFGPVSIVTLFSVLLLVYCCITQFLFLYAEVLMRASSPFAMVTAAMNWTLCWCLELNASLEEIICKNEIDSKRRSLHRSMFWL